jgi:hypothetical protein
MSQCYSFAPLWCCGHGGPAASHAAGNPAVTLMQQMPDIDASMLACLHRYPDLCRLAHFSHHIMTASCLTSLSDNMFEVTKC